MSNKKKQETVVEEERGEDVVGFVKKDIKEETHKKASVSGIEFINTEDKKKIDRRILEIYENPDGTLPDMKHFQKRKRSSTVKAFARLAIACAFLGGVAWIGFFVLQPSNGVGENNDVVLTISGSDKIVSGADSQFRVRYRNAEKIKLKNVTLQVNYPDDFVYSGSSAKPVNNSQDEWKIGDLAAGDSGFVDVIGKLYGEIGKDQSFRAFLNYTPENFSSNFQKSAVAMKHVTDYPVVLEVLNKPISSGGGINNLIEVSLRPIDGAEISNVAVVLDPGSLFSKVNSEPAADKLNTNRWLIDNLTAENKISIRGIFLPTSLSSIAEPKTPQIKVIAWKDNRRSGEGYILASKDVEPPEIVPAVSLLAVSVNGSSVDAGVQPGEELQFNINLKNTGSEPLKNVSTRVVIDAPSKNRKSILDWANIKDPLDGDIKGEQLSDASRRGSIVWNTSKSKGLADIEPGQEVKIEFTIPIKNAKNFDMTGITDADILISAEAQYDLSNKKEITSSAPIKLNLASDMSFEVRDSVSSDSDGQKHSVSWLISNSYHPLKDISVEADVYGDTVWSTSDLQVPAGDVNFDTAVKKLTWKVTEMPESLDVLALQWAVILKTVNPTQTNLTSKIKLTATDAITGKKISKVVDGIVLNR